MPTPETKAERNARMLGALAEAALELALDIQASALAAEDNAEKADLAMAFHRVSRAVRQSLMLDARLERDHARFERELRDETERQVRGARDARRAHVRAAVERAIRLEYEEDEADELVEDLEARLDLERYAPDFGRDPVEAHIERLRADLGLPSDAEGAASVEFSDLDRPGAPPWPGGGPPPRGGDRAAPDWRSSA